MCTSQLAIANKTTGHGENMDEILIVERNIKIHDIKDRLRIG